MRGIPLRQAAIVLILGIALIFPHMATARQGLVTGSITVTGLGQASAPADTATVFITISSEGMMGPVPPSGISVEDEVAPIVDALAGAGADERTIAVITGPSVATAMSYYGPAIAVIRFELADPTAAAISGAVDAATTAATDARLYIGGMSVRLESDQCQELERQAREAAVADAREQAAAIGEMTGLLPGETTSVRDVPPGPESAYIYQNPLADACSPIGLPTIGWEMYGPGSYDPTQEPVVTVYAQVEMTFAASPSILATPSG
jgi:uncharacterized protein YggE